MFDSILNMSVLAYPKCILQIKKVYTAYPTTLSK